MVEQILKFSDQFGKATMDEIAKLKKEIEEKTAAHIDAYVQFHHVIQAKSAKITKTKSEMDLLFTNFEQKFKDAGRAVFVKRIDFYRDYLSKFDFKSL